MIDIVLGTFFGDEGKGQCVNNLASEKSLVVRFSGANQVGHNVVHNGMSHCFRNFGSGTLKGATTYWSEYCVCDLHTLYIELGELKKLGIVPKIIFSPLCELVTPFDVISQWNNESNRKHGTVGTGFKPVLDRVKSGYSLTISDARNLLILREKVYNIGQYYYNFSTTNSLMSDLDDWIFSVNTIANQVALAGIECLYDYDHIIFEGSQGILLDQKHGVMPFCTPSNTTSKNANEILDLLLRSTDEIPLIRTFYVCRPYITRHGNGPLLTTTEIIDVDDQNNPWNDFQKEFRSCKFDLNLLKHSLEIDSIYNKWTNKRYICFSHGKEAEDLTQILSKKGLSIKSFEFEEWL